MSEQAQAQEQELSVVQVEYVNGRCTTDVVYGASEDIAFRIGRSTLDHEWFSFVTRDHGELIIRADQVAFIRARPLHEGEELVTWSDMQRAFRGAEGGGR